MAFGATDESVQYPNIGKRTAWFRAPWNQPLSEEVPHELGRFTKPFNQNFPIAGNETVHDVEDRDAEHSLEGAEILKKMAETGGSTPGLQIHQIVEGYSDPIAEDISEHKAKAKIAASRNYAEELIGHMIGLRLELQQQRESAEIPQELNVIACGLSIPAANTLSQPLLGIRQVLMKNYQRFEWTINNTGANPVYWNTSKMEMQRSGGSAGGSNLGITITAGTSVTVRSQDSIFLYSPLGSTVDVYEKNFTGADNSELYKVSQLDIDQLNADILVDM